MARTPRTDDGHTQMNAWIGRIRRTALIGLSTLLLAAAPAAAQEEFMNQLGSDLGSNGGGPFAFAVWTLLAIVLIVKGIGRCYTAIDHMGELDEDTRRRGRREIRYGGGTFLAGLIGVPVIALVLGRILPESWSWMGVDITGYFSLGGGGGGDSGTAGMIQAPIADMAEVATVGVDWFVMVLPVLV